MSNDKMLNFSDETESGLVEVWQENNQRWLTINGIEQSRIDIANDKILSSSLHHAFLSALLFIDTPQHVLLAGLGGGAIARYLHCIKPDIKGDCVEKNALIASIAKQYFHFPDKQWSVTIDDIRQSQGANYDWIVVDIADDELTPSWLVSEVVLLHLKQQLSINGVLAINLLIMDEQDFIQALKFIRNIFNRKTLCLAVPNHKNIVVLAFNQQPEYYLIEQLEARVKPLTDTWGVDFKTLLSQIQKDNPVGSGII